MPSDQLPDWVLARRRAVGDRIRHKRMQRNMTQERLAERCGLDRKTINRIEGAITSPLLDHLLLIAHELGTPLAALFEEPRSGNPVSWPSTET